MYSFKAKEVKFESIEEIPWTLDGEEVQMLTEAFCRMEEAVKDARDGAVKVRFERGEFSRGEAGMKRLETGGRYPLPFLPAEGNTPWPVFEAWIRSRR